MSNGYPFTSRKQVAHRIASEPAFAVEAVRLVDERNGWMASHRPRAARLVARLADGAPTAEDLVEAIALVTPYARTLSRILRERQIAEGSPELVAQAAVFGVLRSATTQTKAITAPGAPAPVVDTTATEAPATPVKRRPGRPKGSRNRVREEEPAPKRRRRRS